VTLNDAMQGWPTPQAYSSQDSNRPTSVGIDRAAASWPTPRAEDAESAGNHPSQTDSLTGATKMWPTPVEDDANNAEGRATGEFQSLSREAVDNWPSPDTQNGRQGKYTRGEQKGKHALSLHHAIDQWPTPGGHVSNDGESPETWTERAAELKEKGINGNGAGMPLAIAAQLSLDAITAATKSDGDKPGTASDTKPIAASDAGTTDAPERSSSPSQIPFTDIWQTPGADSFRSRGQDRVDEMGLDQQARSEQWATPIERDWKDGDARTQNVPTNGILGRQASRFSLLDQQMSTPGSESSEQIPTSHPQPIARPRQLNPLFVSWLMGLPIWWTLPYPKSFVSPESTRSVYSGMESYLLRQRSHLSSLLGEWSPPTE